MKYKYYIVNSGEWTEISAEVFNDILFKETFLHAYKKEGSKIIGYEMLSYNVITKETNIFYLLMEQEEKRK